MSATAQPRLRGPQRRAVLEAAAAHLFAERGYAGTRLDDIAAAANVTKPILYRHFGSKKALYLALLARHREQQLRTAPPADLVDPADQLLMSLLERWFARVHEQSDTWRMIFRDTTGDAEIVAARGRAQKQARDLLAAFLAGNGGDAAAGARVDAAAAGSAVADPDGAGDLDVAAELVRSAMAGLALWSLDHPEVPYSRLAALVERTVLAVRPGRRP